MRILLTGASGVLGSALADAELGSCIYTPQRGELDLTSASVVHDFIDRKRVDAIVHCAAMARVHYCESHPADALAVNLVGTANLVSAIIACEEKCRSPIRVLYISTDGVYGGELGGYREDGPTIPYSRYGWTKLGGECAVRLLRNYVIVRTRFFDPRHQRFPDAATDIFSSPLPLERVTAAIKKLLHSEYIGAINIGGERMSEYDQAIVNNKEITPTTRKEILTRNNIPIGKDSSMDIINWKNLKRKLS